jgi:hypothetical protein
MGAEYHEVRSILRTAGVGGDVSYLVDVSTSNGDEVYAFRGNLFGGPVLMASKSSDGVVSTSTIRNPGRFGDFATERWVDDFFRHRKQPKPAAPREIEAEERSVAEPA